MFDNMYDTVFPQSEATFPSEVSGGTELFTKRTNDNFPEVYKLIVCVIYQPSFDNRNYRSARTYLVSKKDGGLIDNNSESINGSDLIVTPFSDGTLVQ